MTSAVDRCKLCCLTLPVGIYRRCTFVATLAAFSLILPACWMLTLPACWMLTIGSRPAGCQQGSLQVPAREECRGAENPDQYVRRALLASPLFPAMFMALAAHYGLQYTLWSCFVEPEELLERAPRSLFGHYTAAGWSSQRLDSFILCAHAGVLDAYSGI